MAETGKKKIVRVKTTAAAREEEQAGGSTWKPTAEAKGNATRFRVIAGILWLVAIAAEAFAIFWVLKQKPFETVHLVILIAAIVVIGALAIGGSLLWKKANRYDPASKADKVRFFVQNQLGVIIAIIAFVPLIIMIFLNKEMNGTQKGIAGAIGIVVLLVAGYFGASFNPPSTEQYTTETQQVTDYTGQNLVYWTKEGKVFHLCSDASAVNLDSKDAQIYQGTVADAHAAGKERMTLQIDQELKQCGYPPRTSATDPSPAPTP